MREGVGDWIPWGLVGSFKDFGFYSEMQAHGGFLSRGVKQSDLCFEGIKDNLHVSHGAAHTGVEEPEKGLEKPMGER